jgi:AcrR family transcriptional regulator
VIYDHFHNKEAILLEFTKEGFRILNERLEKAKLQFTDPARQLEAMAYAYWHFAFENQEYYQLMYGLGMPGCEMVQEIPELKGFTDLIMSSLKEMISISNSKQADPYLKFRTFWSMIHGLVSINMMDKGNSKSELNTMVLNDFMNGFLAGIKG